MNEAIEKEIRDGRINGNDTVKVADLQRWSAPAPAPAAAPAPATGTGAVPTA